jgi:hypothetical protein
MLAHGPSSQPSAGGAARADPTRAKRDPLVSWRYCAIVAAGRNKEKTERKTQKERDSKIPANENLAGRPRVLRGGFYATISTHQQGAIFVLQKANQSGGAIPAVVVRVTVLALSKGERPVVVPH